MSMFSEISERMRVIGDCWDFFVRFGDRIEVDVLKGLQRVDMTEGQERLAELKLINVELR